MFNFPAVDGLFQVIDDAGGGVIVPYGNAATPSSTAIRPPQRSSSFEDRRALQRYTAETSTRPGLGATGSPAQWLQ